MNGRFWPIASGLAFVAALVGTWQVHARTGDESFECLDVGQCSLGSGLSWLLTGGTIVGPAIALLGAAWSRRQHYAGRLGPWSRRVLQDGEQIFEILSILAAGLFTYWLIRNGPTIEPATPLDIGRPNTWALDIRNMRQPEGTPEFTDVPTRTTWFVIGAALAAPLAMSFGTMAGREFYGRRRRAEQRLDDELASLDDNVDGNGGLELDN